MRETHTEPHTPSRTRPGPRLGNALDHHDYQKRRCAQDRRGNMFFTAQPLALVPLGTVKGARDARAANLAGAGVDASHRTTTASVRTARFARARARYIQFARWVDDGAGGLYRGRAARRAAGRVGAKVVVSATWGSGAVHGGVWAGRGGAPRLTLWHPYVVWVDDGLALPT